MESYDPYYKLKKMQEPHKASKSLTKANESNHFRGFAKHFVEGATDAGQNVGQLIHVSDLFKMLLASFDFFRIPWKYLKAYLLGKPRPFKFTALGKFVYSLLVLGLVITFMAVHLALPLVAAQLLIATSTITFVWGFYKLVKTIVMSGRYIEQKVEAEEELSKLLEERERIKEQSEKLEVHYAINLKSFYNHTELAALDEVYTEINHLYEHYKDTNKKIEQLEESIDHLNHQLNRKGSLQVMDRSVSVALGAASILGLSLFLFMPPLSLVIIQAVLITSIAYLTVRFVIPMLFILGKLAVNKVRSLGANKEVEPIERDVLDSTARANKFLPANKTRSVVEIPSTMKPDESKAPHPKPAPSNEDEGEDGDEEGVRPARHS